MRRLVTDNVVAETTQTLTAASSIKTQTTHQVVCPTATQQPATRSRQRLLTDPVLGAGEIVSRYQVDYNKMRIAANCCQPTALPGTVSSPGASTCANGSTKAVNISISSSGGCFSLVPALLCGSDNFRITRRQTPDCRCHTDSNAKHKASYLQRRPPAVHRCRPLPQRDRQWFPVGKLTVNLTPRAAADTDPVEEFDLSLLTAEHALNFAKFALRVHRLSYTIEFTPSTKYLALSLVLYPVATESHYPVLPVPRFV